MRALFRGLLCLLACCRPAFAVQWEGTAEIGAQGQLYPNGWGGSVSLSPQFRMDWENRRQLVTIVGFGRWDFVDENRSQIDLREASYTKAWERFELKVGVRQVFWGVTESQHLVDVINQRDWVEDIVGNARFGQPAVSLLWTPADGTNIEAFYLPYFRERTFPGASGRFRPPVPIDTKNPVYENSAERWAGDVALRVTHRQGVLDVGLSHFYGTQREPELLAGPAAPLLPYYVRMNQTGLDLQLTLGALLWKFEGISRWDAEFHHKLFGAVTGVELTLAQLLGTWEVGFLAEYLVDSRGRRATTPWDDDIFAGLRLTGNDFGSSTLLAGIIVDRKNGSYAGRAEASRRFGKHWKLAVKGGLFDGAPADPLAAFSRDDFFQLDLTYFLLP